MGEIKFTMSRPFRLAPVDVSTLHSSVLASKHSYIESLIGENADVNSVDVVGDSFLVVSDRIFPRPRFSSFR